MQWMRVQSAEFRVQIRMGTKITTQSADYILCTLHSELCILYFNLSEIALSFSKTFSFAALRRAISFS